MDGQIHAERFSINKSIIKERKIQGRAFLVLYPYEKLRIDKCVGTSDQQTTDIKD